MLTLLITAFKNSDDSGSFLPNGEVLVLAMVSSNLQLVLSTDVNNYVYVLDKGSTSSRIQKFDSTGAYLTNGAAMVLVMVSLNIQGGISC